MPTGPIDDETLVIMADVLDGSLPYGLEAEQLVTLHEQADGEPLEITGEEPADVQPASTCFGFTAPGGSWGPEVRSDTAVLGNPNHVQSYNFRTGSLSQATVAGQGVGLQQDQYGIHRIWHSLGSVAPGQASAGGTVPWGNVADYPRFRGQTAAVTAATGTWCH
ncbi:hypothetical protein GCM10028800_13280 [Nesterenkonia populi]